MTCDACNRDSTIVMGEYGPIKTPIELVVKGHFKFCDECLFEATDFTETHGDQTWHIIQTLRGPSTNHRWIYQIET